MVQRRTALFECSTSAGGQSLHLLFHACSRLRQVFFIRASGESGRMLWAVGLLTLLVVLLQSASPDGTVQSSGGPDALGFSAPSENARNESKASAPVPRYGDEPSLGRWQLIGSLPETRAAMGAVVWGDYLYILAGATEGSSVIRAHINLAGGLEPWQNMSSMWYEKYRFGTAISGTNLYTFGGYRRFHTALKEVERTEIQADGTLGPWQLASSMSTERPFCSAIAVGNNVYVLGGESTTSYLPMNSVERAAIKPDGSLGAWEPAAAMTTARASPGVVAVNGYIYAIGGTGWDIVQEDFSLASVERAQVNPDGSLGPWQLVTPLTQARRGLAAVVSDSYIYAIGGHNGLNDNPSYNSVERTLVNPDGSLAGWQSSDAMVVPRQFHIAVMWNGSVYAAGGQDLYGDLVSIERTTGPPAAFVPFVVK